MFLSVDSKFLPSLISQFVEVITSLGFPLFEKNSIL